MKQRVHRVMVSFCCLALAATVSAQPSRTPPIDSPVVHPDRTVTFAIKAPDARKVELTAQFMEGNRPLEADDSGVWSVTVGPVEPNLYPYRFIVDGVSVADPGNLDIFPNERFKHSLVDVPGDTPSLYSVQDIPHGERSYCYYASKVVGGTRPLIVYTPPGYREGTSSYPMNARHYLAETLQLLFK